MTAAPSEPLPRRANPEEAPMPEPARRSMNATAEQSEAARVFVRAFARVERYGGGCRVLLRVPGGGVIDAVDGWHGQDEAVERVASILAERWAGQTYHESFRPLEAVHA